MGFIKGVLEVDAGLRGGELINLYETCRRLLPDTFGGNSLWKVNQSDAWVFLIEGTPFCTGEWVEAPLSSPHFASRARARIAGPVGRKNDSHSR